MNPENLISYNLMFLVSTNIYRLFKNSMYSRYVVASLQHAEIDNMVFLSRLVTRIYDSRLLLRSAYELDGIISDTFCKYM
jgi:hypothetical protein